MGGIVTVLCDNSIQVVQDRDLRVVLGGLQGLQGTQGIQGPSFGWGNVRNAFTAAHTITSADASATVALGGSAFYALTFPAASTLASNFICVVTNEDSGRGKTITYNSTSFILWPGQTVVIFNDNNTWVVFGRSRWKLPSEVILFVDAAAGNDANDGLAAGSAVQSIFQAAVNIGQNQFDCFTASSPQVLLQLADGTYTGGLHYPGILTGGAGHATLVIKGNATTPGNVVIEGDGSGGSPISLFDNAIIELKDLTLFDLHASLLQVDSGATCRLMGGIIFAGCGPGAAHIQCTNDGSVINNGGYSISGNASDSNGYHVLAFDGGKFNSQGQTITISANLTFNTTILAQRLARVNVGTVTWSAGSFGVGGKRFQADDLAMISVFGAGASAIPGGSSGTTSNGGQCA